jgi:hypothetical protein
MTEDVLWTLACWAIVFLINLVPAFMPSSWMVMAFFYIRFDLPLLPLTIGGALVSGLGRLLLARGSGWFSTRFMPSKQGDLQFLGRYLERYRRAAAPATFVYTLSPLPTNNLFIAAGMVGMNMFWVLMGFWAGRIIADTFWVWTTERVFSSLEDVFTGAFSSPLAIALQIASAAVLVVLYLLPWSRWLRRIIERRANGATPEVS